MDGPSNVLAWSAAAQAFFALVLIFVTIWYVVLTSKLAKSAEQQIKLNMTPNLVFEPGLSLIDPGAWRIVNLGVYSALIHAIHVQLLSGREEVVGRGLLKTDGQILRGWKKVVRPNEEIQVQNVGTGTFPPGTGMLSGLVRLSFFFVYGPTAQTTHALDVKLRIAGTGVQTQILDQSLRLSVAVQQLPPTSIDQIQPT